jgi:CBS domain-containing protein
MDSGQLKLIDVIEQLCIRKDVSFEPMRLARDIMNTDFRTLTLDHNVNRCLQLMEGLKIRHVPVVDLPYEGEDKPCFIGVVSKRDILRIKAADDKEAAQKKKKPRKALRQLLVQIVTRKPKSARPDTPIQDVITTLTANHIDMVPVLDNDDLVGIITTTDIMKLFLMFDKLINQLCPELKTTEPPAHFDSECSEKTRLLHSWLFRQAREIMTEQVISLTPEDNLAVAIEILQHGKFRHIPILDEQQKLVGLLSDRDILSNLPYAEKKPPTAPKIFREHLFATNSTDFLLPLENIMVRKVLRISPRSTISEAADILHSKKISCLLVVDENEKLCGIITVTDMMQTLLTAYELPVNECLVPEQSST